MQHFFVAPECFTENSVRVNDLHIIHQMKKVLRMRQGNQCIFLDNSGFEFLSEITRLDEKEMTATVLEKRKNRAEPTLFATLYQALPKKMELFEWVLQKGTEIGVSEFVPLITERTERREIPKRDRLLKILKEAAEQSERGKIPELKEPVEFERAIQNQSVGVKILLHSRGEFPLFSEKLGELKTQSRISLFIGSEGGFSNAEIEKARAHRVLIYSLGPRVVRTETAGIAAASLILL
jgi:16S rRNA (uracil1498-N3)-methyltransferase